MYLGRDYGCESCLHILWALKAYLQLRRQLAPKACGISEEEPPLLPNSSYLVSCWVEHYPIFPKVFTLSESRKLGAATRKQINIAKSW